MQQPTRRSVVNFFFIWILHLCHAYHTTGKIFFHLPTTTEKPQLVLISGATGAGKSTFGMSVALNQGIIRCLSTDSIREILRSCDPQKSNAALHRSTYSGTGDPVEEWKECCSVLHPSIDSLVDDSLKRGVSMVLEGVHLMPSYANDWINKWRAGGGHALGCVLTISDEKAHEKLIFRRGEITKKSFRAENQMQSLKRIRKIQDAMIHMAQQCNWLLIEQKVEPDPVETIQHLLHSSS